MLCYVMPIEVVTPEVSIFGERDGNRFFFKVRHPPGGGVTPRPLWIRPKALQFFLGPFFRVIFF